MRFAYRRRGLVVRGRLAAGLLRRRDSAFPHRACLPNSPGTGEHQSLIGRHPGLHARSQSWSDFAVHSRLIALEKREVVTEDQKLRKLDVAGRSLPQGILGLREAVETEIIDSDSRVWTCVGRIE